MSDIKKKKQAEPEQFPPIEGPVEIVGVNFKEAGKIYYFSPKDTAYAVGDRVIVETSRGIEMGTVKIANKVVDGATVVPPLKPVIRAVTEEDLEKLARNREAELNAAIVCKRKIKEHKLDMSLVCAEYTFDRSKLTFYFTCETRVDFRELVKDLASTFRTRIELRQIGIRDETKMMGGLGICGRKYCCAGFLTDFVQVSIKMAKEQNFSLNSAKISGACGRLMCCLRYEHETYEQAIKVTPPTGTVVESPDGVGVVVETRPLSLEVKVKLNDKDKDDVKIYPIADLRLLPSAPKGDKEAKKESENGKPRERSKTKEQKTKDTKEDKE